MTSVLRVLAASVAAGTLASACGNGGESTSTPTGDVPPIVIEFTTSTSCCPPEPPPEELPELTVYENGQVVFWDGRDGSVPRIFTSRVDRTELADVLAGAQDAGLLDTPVRATGSAGFGEPHVTRVVLRHDGRSRTHLVDALKTRDPPANLTAEQVATRHALRQLSQVHRQLDQQDVAPFTPDALAVYASVGSAGRRAVRPWPIGRGLGDGDELGGAHERCLLVTGNDVAEVLEVARRHPSGRWSSGGEDWVVDIRPLLPHEHKCPADASRG